MRCLSIGHCRHHKPAGWQNRHKQRIVFDCERGDDLIPTFFIHFDFVKKKNINFIFEECVEHLDLLEGLVLDLLNKKWQTYVKKRFLPFRN